MCVVNASSENTTTRRRPSLLGMSMKVAPIKSKPTLVKKSSAPVALRPKYTSTCKDSFQESVLLPQFRSFFTSAVCFQESTSYVAPRLPLCQDESLDFVGSSQSTYDVLSTPAARPSSLLVPLAPKPQQEMPEDPILPKSLLLPMLA